MTIATTSIALGLLVSATATALTTPMSVLDYQFNMSKLFGKQITVEGLATCESISNCVLAYPKYLDRIAITVSTTGLPREVVVRLLSCYGTAACFVSFTGKQDSQSEPFVATSVDFSPPRSS